MCKTKKLNKYKTDIKLNIKCKDTNIIKYNIKLGDYHKIENIKNKIEYVNQEDWAKIRKYTNNYEAPFYNTKRKVISRAFYKLWEILYDFKINCNCETLHLCEAPGGFVEAMIEYKIKKYNEIKKCHTISLIKNKKIDIPKYHKNISKNKNVNVITKGEGDLYNMNTLIYIYSSLKNKNISFITGDGGITENGDYNNKEAIHVRLILSQIFVSCIILEDNGTFILKIFDIYTDITGHIIYILNYLFNEVTITKPLTSRPTNSEKYLVCQGYLKGKFNITIKNEIFKCLKKISENSKLQVYSLIDNVEDEFLKEIKEYNNIFMEEQITNIENNLKLLKNEDIKLYNFIGKRNEFSRNWLIKYRLT